jgi:hypothetical protein
MFNVVATFLDFNLMCANRMRFYVYILFIASGILWYTAGYSSVVQRRFGIKHCLYLHIQRKSKISNCHEESSVCLLYSQTTKMESIYSFETSRFPSTECFLHGSKSQKMATHQRFKYFGLSRLYCTYGEHDQLLILAYQGQEGRSNYICR